jgi:hypothetical protein
MKFRQLLSFRHALWKSKSPETQQSEMCNQLAAYDQNAKLRFSQFRYQSPIANQTNPIRAVSFCPSLRVSFKEFK